MPHVTRRVLRHAPIALAVLAVALCVAPLQAATTGQCVQADIDAEIVLPNGDVYQAGSLKICLDNMYSPVSGLHRVSVDGQPAGFFVSRSADAEEAEGEAFLQFARNSSGPMFLQAYTLSDGETFTFRALPSVTTSETIVAENRSVRFDAIAP